VIIVVDVELMKFFCGECWLLRFGVCFGDFEMTLDDEILGIFMEICDEV